MAESTQTQKLEIRNATSSALEIMVEMYPDRYVLQPNDKMVIEADLSGAPFTVVAYGDSLQIYPGNDCGPPVTINDVSVESDWSTPGPNSNDSLPSDW